MPGREEALEAAQDRMVADGRHDQDIESDDRSEEDQGPEERPAIFRPPAPRGAESRGDQREEAGGLTGDFQEMMNDLDENDEAQAQQRLDPVGRPAREIRQAAVPRKIAELGEEDDMHDRRIGEPAERPIGEEMGRDEGENEARGQNERPLQLLSKQPLPQSDDQSPRHDGGTGRAEQDGVIADEIGYRKTEDAQQVDREAVPPGEEQRQKPGDAPRRSRVPNRASAASSRRAEG